MSSVVPTGAVASVGARRLPAHRASSAGRRSVIARSGKRAGRGSKISRESLIVSAEKKRDKAYGYAYGYAYGWDYGHEYGDPDWGHVTGTMSTPEARAEASVARPKDVDSPSRQAEVAVAEKTPAKEEKPIKEEKPAEPVPAPSAPSAPAAPPLVPVQPLPPPPAPRPASVAPKPPSPKEVARRLNEADLMEKTKGTPTPAGSFTYRSKPDGTLSRTAEFRAPPIAKGLGSYGGAGGSFAEGRFFTTLTTLTNAFPLWVLLGAVVGIINPPSVTWFKGEMITTALAVTMLGMGLTLELDDFFDAVRQPKQVALGVALQYTIMPTLGLAIGKVFPVHASVAVGLILVGCCPGGTASNVVTYLGKANVALSVVLTTVSTFLAAFMTPLMTKTLAGTIVPVDAIGLAKSTASVVLAPVIVGLLAKRFAPKLVRVVAPFCPLVAVATVALICASIIGSSASAILAAGPALLLAVTTLHSLGFFLGYFFSKVLGFAEKDRRTVSIEVGMQNSALGVVLATAHFADPLVAVPCAISATVHSCVGSLVAGAWRLADQRLERATRGGR
jgi:bile acid:Na+ symporter, BASS family